MTFPIKIADLLAVKVNEERIREARRRDADLVVEYAKRLTPFPAIALLRGRDVIRDGHHRVAAAILRGDSTIMAIELADDSQALRKLNAESDAIEG